MPSQPQHGRRRAAPPVSGHRAPLARVLPLIRGKSTRFGAAAATTGLIAVSILSAAQAAPDRFEVQENVPASAAEAGVAAQPVVSAGAGASLSFDRPMVTSRQAPPPETAKAAAAPATAAPAPAAPAPVEASGSLQAPLASVQISSFFGLRVNPLTGATGEWHTGIDLAGACSTPVYAAGAGKVVEAGWSQYGGGNRIVVDHGNGLKTTYNHLASIGVSVGQTVAKGVRIAGVGSTGNSTGCHLHFEVLVNDKTVDPASFI